METKKKMLVSMQKLIKSTAVNGGGVPSWFMFAIQIPRELKQLIEDNKRINKWDCVKYSCAMKSHFRKFGREILSVNSDLL